MTRYLVAGARFGLAANAAVMVFSTLYAVETVVLKKFAKWAEAKMKEQEERKAEDISDVNPDTSDDLK